MATINVAYKAAISGTEDVQKKLKDVNKTGSELSHGMSEIGRSAKEVAKDLDNLGLSAGKTFTMAAEGAFSVATALASGGLAGAVGLATLGVGLLVQAYVDAEAESERLRQLTEDLDKKFQGYATTAKSVFTELGKPVDIKSVMDAEATVQGRRVAQHLMFMDMMVEQEKLRVLRSAAEAAKFTMGDKAALKAVEEQEKKIAAMRESADAHSRETIRLQRKQQEDEEQARLIKKEDEDKKKADEARKKAEAEAEQARKAAARKREEEQRKEEERSWKATQDYWYRVVKEANDANGRILEARKKASQSASEFEISEFRARVATETQAIRAAADARVSIFNNTREAIRSEEADLLAFEIESGKRALESRVGTTQRDLAVYNQAAAERMAVLEREQTARRSAEREEAARTYAREEQHRELNEVEVDALREQADLDRLLSEQRINNRKREADAAVDSATQQEEAASRLLRQQTALSVATSSYAIVLDNTLTPAINGLANATRELGAINWETYDQYRITLKDIPPLMLQRAQAELFSAAITSAGLAAQETAKGVGYLGEGAAMAALGMPNASGMFAAAGGAFTSAGLHAAFATAQGVGAVGAFGAGMALSQAGAAGFTRDDTERRGGRSQTGLPGLSRLTGTGDGSTTGGGTVGGGGGGGTTYNQTVVLDYSNALVLDPDDQRRAQRVWNEVQAANNRDGWGTL